MQFNRPVQSSLVHSSPIPIPRLWNVSINSIGGRSIPRSLSYAFIYLRESILWDEDESIKQSLRLMFDLPTRGEGEVDGAKNVKTNKQSNRTEQNQRDPVFNPDAWFRFDWSKIANVISSFEERSADSIRVLAKP